MASSSARSLASLAFLTSTIFAGVILRCVGYARGSEEIADPRDGTEPANFHRFHPDEELVIGGALGSFDWLNPPFTAYGILPSHLLRLCLYLVSGLFDWPHLDLGDPENARRIYYVARALAICFSVATMPLVWVASRRHFGNLQANLAVAIVAYSPGAIQQAHFFIIDGLFLLATTATLCTIVEATRTRAFTWFAVSGFLIGLSAAVRLNGIALALILASFCFLVPMEFKGEMA